MIVMKRICSILVAVILTSGVSCSRDTQTIGTKGEQEVEIIISTSGQGAHSRAPLDGYDEDAGSDTERVISTLDVLVFDNTGYLYRREAYKVSTGVDTYRVVLQESDKELDVYLFANVSEILQAWDGASDRTGLPWTTVSTQLVDRDPKRLVSQDEHVPLPMYGYKLGQRIDTEHAPSRWGDVQMRRSVASVDLYVEDTQAIRDKFQLTGLLAWYAPDRGYPASMEDAENTTPAQQYLSPEDMATSLNGVVGGQMHANSVLSYLVEETGANGEPETKSYTGVAYQIYFYDNPAVSTADGDTKRPTRIIVAGRFEIGDDVWQDSYYPLDVVYDDGAYRPLIRNWKYEFKVVAVRGPGYTTPEAAAEGAPIDLNVEIIPWNKDDVEIGVKGRYYVSMRSKSAILWREQYDAETLDLTYQVLDDDPVAFTIDFADDTWGAQRDMVGGNGIENDYFRVEMTHTPGTGGGSVAFGITALQAMPENEEPRREFVTVRMRDLVFTIGITQLDQSEDGWDNGDDLPIDL